MKLFLLLVLLSSPLLLAQTWENEGEKRAGETITITWEYDADDEAQLTAWSLYRQTGVSNTPSKVASALPSAREFVYVMPSGTTKQYRFFVRPVKGTLIGPAGTEVIINRVK